MAQIIVKLHYNNEIRRFTCSPDELTWGALNKRVTKAFEIIPSKSLRVTYIDDEKDVITIASNDELAEAIGLAQCAAPPVLRLTIVAPKGTEADTTESPTNTTNTNTNPTADAAAAANLPLAGVPPELAPFLKTLAAQLPGMMASLPDNLKAFLPHAELDLDATIRANAAANNLRANHHVHAEPTDKWCSAMPHKAGAKEGVHEGVTCDKSGMSPIVGNRYHLVGHNYDLCEAEYLKLDDRERKLFRKVAPPAAPAAAAAAADKNNDATNSHGAAEQSPPANNVHPGVECDKSGMCPIVGTRYHLRGHNYDLCQAEYDKLSANEKQLYEAMPPPQLGHGFGHHGPWGRHGPWGWRGMRGGPGMMGGMGGMGGPCNNNNNNNNNNAAGNGMGCGPKLAARFVRDVTIFDGTQMAPGTPFTKIWRLKNVGEVPWPPGTKMLFVGGDQMTSEMAVPLSRGSAVMPGEEVDVAVEMVAPKEHGRYLGYWRLTGPMMRRKFGQKVWCHVQVVDPSASGAEAFEDMPAVLAEIERKKSDLAQQEAEATTTEEAKEGEVHDDDDDLYDDAPTKGETMKKEEPAAAAAAAAAVPATVVSVEAAAPTAAEAAAKEEDKDDETTSDDGVLVTDGMLAEATDVTDPGPSSGNAAGKAVAGSAPLGVRGQLRAMGFDDVEMIEAVVNKNGDDVEACARDLAAASEWADALDDLAEMGFGNRELNKTLMLKNAGNMKRTVRDLVEA